MTAPVVEVFEGVHVVRDDLYPGGTKARFLTALFADAEEIVYASPAEGGAQTALAWAAKVTGKRATIFVAKRTPPHPRAVLAKAWGAKVLQVKPGYLSVVQKRAADYAADRGVTLAPFGIDVPGNLEAIADAARATGVQPDEVWCASGSGVLARGLALAFPNAARFAVQVGRDLSPADVAGARVFVYDRDFSKQARIKPPFPSDPHYDAKAWEVCLANKGPGTILFWNVTGPAIP